MTKFHLSAWTISKLASQNIVLRKSVPLGSALTKYLPHCYFSDSYEKFNCDPRSCCAVSAFSTLAKATPKWMDILIPVRNVFVRPLGLKPLRHFSYTEENKSIESYKVGDKISFFQVLEVHEKEVILEVNDKHMHVRISLMRCSENNSAIYSTVVHTHSLLGKAYMLFELPAHKWIVPVWLSGIPDFK